MQKPFRFDRAYGRVFKYSPEHKAYLFCGSIHPGESEQDWVVGYWEEMADERG